MSDLKLPDDLPQRAPTAAEQIIVNLVSELAKQGVPFVLVLVGPHPDGPEKTRLSLISPIKDKDIVKKTLLAAAEGTE